MSEIERKWSILDQFTAEAEKTKKRAEVMDFTKKSILDEEHDRDKYNLYAKKLEQLNEYSLAQRLRRIADAEHEHQAILLNVLRELREKR